MNELATEPISAGADRKGLMPDGSMVFTGAIRHGKTVKVLAILSKGADPHLPMQTAILCFTVLSPQGKRNCHRTDWARR